MIMGTAILFQVDRVVPANAGAFATELMSIFTSIIGEWSYPVIGGSCDCSDVVYRSGIDGCVATSHIATR